MKREVKKVKNHDEQWKKVSAKNAKQEELKKGKKGCD